LLAVKSAQSGVSGNALLRRAQRDATARGPLPVASAMAAAKIANQRALLRRHLRDYGDAAGRIDDVERRLTASAQFALDAQDLDALRGAEGDAARVYFSVFPALIRTPGWSFEGRSQNPPLNAMNALLSFLYVLLSSDCRGALETEPPRVCRKLICLRACLRRWIPTALAL
jgi:CRISPR-associated protein Cas1